MVDHCTPLQGFERPNQGQDRPDKEQASDVKGPHRQAGIEHKVADTASEKNNGID